MDPCGHALVNRLNTMKLKLASIVIVALIGVASCSRPSLTSPTTPLDTQPLDFGVDGADTVGPTSICGDFVFPKAQALDTDERVDTILSSMSLANKVDQMAGLQPGSADIFSTPDNENFNIRGFAFRDGPRGVRLEEGSATCFPVSVARGASWEPDLERRVGRAMGAEVRGLGHNVLLAPCINTLRHPGWGRAQETYGEDPWFLGVMGTAFTQGSQEHVPVCVKHLAGNNLEDSRHTNNAIIDERTLRENYLRQFRMVIEDADVACVMSAYNKVNGFYCSENNHLLREILKDEWAFDGFVVSDWFATHTTVESAVAGLDVEMPWRINYANLQSAVESGQVDEEMIDDAVRRILRIKFKYGFALLDEAFEGDPSVVESAEHIALAREAGRKGMVLLKNNGAVLPLAKKAGTRIAVVGPFADIARLGDSGSSTVTPSYAVTPFQGIRDGAGSDVEVVTSTDASAAQDADIAIVVAALTDEDEGEAIFKGGDRDVLDLSPEDESLINQVSTMVDTTLVVLEAGGPITMANWESNADAIIMAWYPGMEGGNALADLVFGKHNFSGRVIQTWPKKLEDEPLFGNDQDETVFEYFHGYRHFDAYDIEPLFPFGFGLSYTTFEYSNLELPCATITPGGRLEVSFDVTNTGTRDGVEVAQLYVSYPESAVERPKRELKGFTHVELAVGETKRATIAVKIADLAYYDVEKSGWTVEAVKHGIHVGANARDLPLSGAFWVGDEGVLATEADPPVLVDEEPSPDVVEDTSTTETVAPKPETVTPSGPATVIFQVDMAGFDPVYLASKTGGVYLQAEFNNWCGLCEPLMDADGDGVWTRSRTMEPGTYQYKYTINGWNGLQETVPVACDLVPQDGQDNRYVVVGEDDIETPIHYFGGCPGDGEPTPQAAQVTFQVDMTGVDTTGGVYLQGIFNGWCGHCEPLAEGADGIWSTTVPLLPGSYQYKYTTDGWNGLVEALPDTCDPYPNDEFQNRSVEVGDDDMTIPLHAWEICP
jgi:beta-glucosidase